MVSDSKVLTVLDSDYTKQFNPTLMESIDHVEQELLEKIRSLPPEKAAQVLDFVDFLTSVAHREGERLLTRAMTKLSEGSFARVWDNAEDAEYDRL